MIKYTSNSHKKIWIFSDDIKKSLYPDECLENNEFFEKNMIVETEVSYHMPIVKWVGLFFRCFFSTMLKIIIMEFNTNWILNVDPFYIRTVEKIKINNRINYSKSVFKKDGTLSQFPVLEIDEKEVTIDIFVDFLSIKREFLVCVFELCWLTLICEILISLIFIFSGKYNLLLFLIFIIISIIIIIPTILKIVKLHGQYVLILNKLKQMS